MQPGYKAELPALLDSVIFRDFLIFFRVPYRYFDSPLVDPVIKKGLPGLGAFRSQTHAKLLLHLGLRVLECHVECEKRTWELQLLILRASS